VLGILHRTRAPYLPNCPSRILIYRLSIIFISARNGFVDQLLRARRLHGRWIFASKVMRGYKNDEVLLEKIDEGFPRNKQGQVDWQAY
jgi:hypothetical protein